MVPSKLDLPAGSSIRVQDAIYAIVTKSANDVAVAVAERLGGTESGFARMMTRRARELGMNNTTFVNASGLHNPQQISSARDMAILARTVINQHPGYYRYFSTANFTYKGRSYHNHNRLMETYKGMDGMKTGYVGPSGFNLVASAVRKDRRLIGVVFGGRTTASRNAHMAELLDRGFDKTYDIRIAKADKQASPPHETPAGISENSGITVANLDPKTVPPVPPRKPVILTALNTLNKVTPTGGQVKLASFSPIDTSRYGELAGEGDIDPAETRRIETGLVAASAIRGSEMNANNRLLTAPAADDKWSVQIGAFSSRAASDRAIGNAVRKLPASIGGSPAIAPLKVKDGWVFRARLGGYSREQAFRACKYIQECMPVAPQNN
jgi:D-alanyl-D-alanine carboxypeptidase